MKLNLNAKELLALHDLLRDNVHYTSTSSIEENKTTLLNIYNRLRFCVLSALKNNGSDPIETWLEIEQQKIDKLIAESKVEDRDTDPDSLNKDEALLQDDFANDCKTTYPRRSSSTNNRHHKNKK